MKNSLIFELIESLKAIFSKRLLGTLEDMNNDYCSTCLLPLLPVPLRPVVSTC